MIKKISICLSLLFLLTACGGQTGTPVQSSSNDYDVKSPDSHVGYDIDTITHLETGCKFIVIDYYDAMTMEKISCPQ